jgi:uncharacterized membrane protein YeaQ/YmgE (transglycosylase-associated protein family)
LIDLHAAPAADLRPIKLQCNAYSVEPFWAVRSQMAGHQASYLHFGVSNSYRGNDMGIIGTIFIGLIVGLLARFLKPGDDSMGWIMTILLGIGGSLAATYGGQALGIYQAGEGAGFLGALVGAVVLLVLYGLIRKN